MEQSTKPSIFARPIVQTITGMLVIALLTTGIFLYKTLSARIVLDRSTIEAPDIALGAQTGGVLEEVYVHEGDTVSAGQNVARVGTEIISATVGGMIVSVSNTPGQVFAPGAPVVHMIDSGELRVVGIVKENEGLAALKVGDPVIFTVDAFGRTKYTGIVERISAQPRSSGVAFSISDKREIKEFEVSVRYDSAHYPGFKQGMSAKMRIYTK